MTRKAHILAIAMLSAGPAFAQATTPPFDKCFETASTRFGVDKRMLVAIAKTESSLNPNAVGPKNFNGTYDLGIMQINTGWLPTLAKFGISKSDLMGACTNIYVGAWIVYQNINRHGSTWRAVGAYNAVTPTKQVVYAKRVHKNYLLIGEQDN